MPLAGISLGTGLGGGTSATSSGAAGGGGAPAYANEFSGSFDGTDDYISIGNVTNLNSANNFTISVWFKRPASATDMLLGGTGGTGIGMYPWTGSKFYVHAGMTGTLSVTLPGEDEWINAIVTYDSSANTILYINGSSAGTVSASAIPATAGNDFSIGIYPAYAYKYLGLIDEVAIWDATTLNAGNVGEVYHSGAPMNLAVNSGDYDQSSNLTHWYRFGDDAADTGTGGVADGNVITNIENAANPGTNDGSIVSAPTFSTTVPT